MLSQNWWIQDFHLHTHYSDGDLAPETVLTMVYRAGIREVAITDHESVRAYLEVHTNGQIPPEMRLHPGIELDCEWQGYEVHLLGIGFDPEHPELRAYLDEIHAVRRREYTRVMDQINQILGEPFLTPETVFPAPIETWMKPHLFRRLGDHPRFRHLHPDDRYRYFKEWMREYDIHIRIPKLPIDRAITLIHLAGGYAVLAHPGYYWKHGMPFPESLLALKERGLDGIEVFYPYFQPRAPEFPNETEATETVVQFYRWAREYGLLMTRGSDIHQADHYSTRYPHLQRIRQRVAAL